jgi:biopolymer transport protein ExbD
MVDVVFLLLVFAFEPDDVHAILNADRPGNTSIESHPGPPTVITILQDRYLLNGKAEPFSGLQKKFHKLAERGVSPQIRIICNPDSQHARLIRILNLCEDTDLTKISLMSMRPQ